MRCLNTKCASPLGSTAPTSSGRLDVAPLRARFLLPPCRFPRDIADRIRRNAVEDSLLMSSDHFKTTTDDLVGPEFTAAPPDSQVRPSVTTTLGSSPIC